MFSAPVRACLLLVVTVAMSASAVGQPPAQARVGDQQAHRFDELLAVRIVQTAARLLAVLDGRLVPGAGQ